MKKFCKFVKNRKEPYWFSIGAVLLLFVATCILKNIYTSLFVIGGFLFVYAALIVSRTNDLIELLRKSSIGASIPKEKKKVKKLIEVEVDEDE